MSIPALGKAMTQPAAFITPYTVPASGMDFATLNAGFVNKGPVDAKIRLVLTTEATTPNPEDYIEYDAVVPANGGIFDRTCIIAFPGEKVMVFCDKDTVAVRIAGLGQETV